LIPPPVCQAAAMELKRSLQPVKFTMKARGHKASSSRRHFELGNQAESATLNL
jgi:hypothetical protein